MKKLTIILAILFATITYAGSNVTELYGLATFINTPSASDYEIGFIYGENRDNLTFAPMGTFSWDGSSKQLTWMTQLTNLEIDKKFYFAPQVIPVKTISKFKVTNTVGWIDDLYQEPFLEFDLPRRVTGDIDSTVTFTWQVSGANISYKWYRRTVNVDSTLQADSSYTYQFSWNAPVKINGETGAIFTSPALSSAWDGLKVFSVAKYWRCYYKQANYFIH